MHSKIMFAVVTHLLPEGQPGIRVCFMDDATMKEPFPGRSDSETALVSMASILGHDQPAVLRW